MLCTVLASMIWFCDCVIIEVIVCQYCWRWTGFSFGFDLLVSLTGRWVAYVAKHCLFVYVSAVLSTSDVWQCLCGLVSDGLYFVLLLQNCYHIWRHHCVCVEDTNITLLLVTFYLLLIPFCRQNLRLLLLPGNKCNPVWFKLLIFSVTVIVTVNKNISVTVTVTVMKTFELQLIFSNNCNRCSVNYFYRVNISSLNKTKLFIFVSTL